MVMVAPLPHAPAWSRMAPPGSIRYRFAQPLSLVSSSLRTSVTFCPALPVKVRHTAWPYRVTLSGSIGPFTFMVPVLTEAAITAELDALTATDHPVHDP